MAELINLERAMNQFGSDFIKVLTEQLLMADKKASGNLIRSLDYEVIEAMNKYVLQIKAASYLSVVDKGRKANRRMPPTGIIEKWITVKPIQRFRDKKGRFISKKSQAFIISRSIGRKGIRPTNVIKKSINLLLKSKKELLSQAVGKDIRQFINTILNNK